MIALKRCTSDFLAGEIIESERYSTDAWKKFQAALFHETDRQREEIEVFFAVSASQVLSRRDLVDGFC